MKILIVGPAWVGDMVIAHALVRTLLAAEPAAEIHVVAPPATAPLGRRMPGVAESVTLPVRHGELGWRARRDVGRALRRVRYDRAIVLPNSFKSALVPFFAAIPRRTGWRGEWRYGLLNDMRTLDAARMPRLVDRFVALGDASVAFSDASVAFSDPPPRRHPNPGLAPIRTAPRRSWPNSV